MSCRRKRRTLEERIEAVRGFIVDMHNAFTGEWAKYPAINMTKLAAKYHFEKRMTSIILDNEFIVNSGVGRNKRYKRRYDTIPDDEVIKEYIRQVKKQRQIAYYKRWNKLSEQQKKEYYSRLVIRRKSDGYSEKRMRDRLSTPEMQEILGKFASTILSRYPTSYLVEDLVQECSLQALLYHYRYNTDTNIKTWLYQVMLHINLQRYRKDRIRENARENLLYMQEEFDKEKEDNEELSAKIIRSAITTLSEHDREIITRVMEGVKYKKIGEELKHSEDYIKARVNVIKKKMKCYVEENFSMVG